MVRSVIRLAIVGALLVAPLVQAQAAPPGVEEGTRELAVQLANAMSAGPGAQSAGNGAVRKLAVIEFSDLNGYRSALGSFIAEELTTQLFVAKPGVFDIVERQQLAKVLQEQKLGSSGLFDAETIANIGKILGIQAIITGSIADLGEDIKINARLISVESARVFAAASVKCPKKGVVETLMRQGAAPEQPGAQPAARPAGRQVQASDVFFQNEIVRLTVDSLALSKNGGDATLSLRLENLTSSDLYLAVYFRTQYCRTGLLDNRGNIFEAADAYERGVIGMVCLNPGSDLVQEHFTRFSAKSRSTVIFPFRLDKAGDAVGNVYTFSTEFLMFEGGKVSRFSVGIPNIELR